MKTTVEVFHINGDKIVIKDIPDSDHCNEEEWMAIQRKLGSFIDKMNYLSDPEPVYSAEDIL